MSCISRICDCLCGCLQEVCFPKDKHLQMREYEDGSSSPDSGEASPLQTGAVSKYHSLNDSFKAGGGGIDESVVREDRNREKEILAKLMKDKE